MNKVKIEEEEKNGGKEKLFYVYWDWYWFNEILNDYFMDWNLWIDVVGFVWFV